VQSVPRAQIEGAVALSLSPAQRMRRVVLPQALVEMIPPFNTLFIQLLKSTALLAFVSIPEITTLARTRLVANFPSQSFAIWLVVLVMYLLLALAITLVMRLTERAAAARVGRVPSARARKLAATTVGGA
jgi:polar amino acid transport system permease protein